MTGRNNWLRKWAIRCGLALGVLGGGSGSLGLEVVAQQDLFFHGGRQARPLIQAVAHVPTEQTQDGFVVAASGTAIQDTPAGLAMQHIEAGDWVKAIQAIESLSETDSDLVLDERGVLRPLSAMKSALIASMPEQGRRTFCKLNDPAANTKLAEALAATNFQSRAAAFKSIVDNYALCDAAATAALQIGDIRFEQGRFNEAAAYYRFAEKHPAQAADDPALMARRLTALSRAQQWTAFEELAEYARFRHPETTIQIAGQTQTLKSVIAELNRARRDVTQPPDETEPARLNLPQQLDREYDRRLIAGNHQRLLQQVAQNNNLSSIIDQTIAPNVATDGERLFSLTLGRVARLNPQTGTELWHIGDDNALVQKIQQRMYYLTGGLNQSLTVAGDTLLAAMPGEQRNFETYLHAIDAETGETRWSTYDTHRDAMVGDPLVIDDRVYYITYDASMSLTLRIARLSDGSQVSELALGKASKGPNLNSPAELSPRLTMGQGLLLVQTNNGALIAVDVDKMAIAWAFSQKIRQSGMNTMRRRGMFVPDVLARHTGDVVADGGLVVAKDTRTNRVVALREYDAAMVWTAPCDADATIVHHDKQHIYVLGSELVALDRRTGQRVWWTPHAGDQAGTPVFTQDACLIQGDTRLCRVDLRTGKLTQYHENVAEAADLKVVGNRLISVGQEGITAIALP